MSKQDIQFLQQQFMVLCRAYFPDCVFWPDFGQPDAVWVRTSSNRFHELIFDPHYLLVDVMNYDGVAEYHKFENLPNLLRTVCQTKR